MPDSLPQPEWSRKLMELYESNAVSQFLLHGNVADNVVWERKGAVTQGSLSDYLKDNVLGPFDVVLTYQLGEGVAVARGAETFRQWPVMAAGMPEISGPREAMGMITRYLRYTAGLHRMGKDAPSVAVLILNAELALPDNKSGVSFDLAAVALQVRDWAADTLLRDHAIATFLISGTLSDLHRVILNGNRAAVLEIPLPGVAEIAATLEAFDKANPGVLDGWRGKWDALASQLTGSALSSLESLLRVRAHRKSGLTPADVRELKRDIIERDAQDLIEFVESDRSLKDLYGQEAVKEWMRQDIALWEQGDLQAMPMGYLLCGPVGTGKTFMVECLSGEAGVPVVKLKNFRDRWVGSTEGNLEKIFRLLHALGRCVVFVDEADQTLGSRKADSGDSGVSNRVYSMIAQEMSDTRNRGKILWALASSRPDLIEVDLKRPGRVDVKIPIFPAATLEEGLGLLRALCKRRGLVFTDEEAQSLLGMVPDILTPGTAEAISVKAYRNFRTQNNKPVDGLREALKDYRPAVPPEVMAFQIQLAVDEASDERFIPERFRPAP